MFILMNRLKKLSMAFLMLWHENFNDLILIPPCMQSMTSPFTKLEEAIYIIKV